MTEIRPVTFKPKSAGQSRSRRFRIGPGMLLTWLIFALLVVTAWWVFTMRSVEIAVTPSPDRFTLTGTRFSISLGGRHMLRPGDYRVRAEKEGYSGLDVEVVVTDEPYQSFSFTLDKLPGRLLVEADVVGATVWINGEERGKTPLEIEGMAVGDHEVRVESERREDFLSMVNIRGAGQTDTVRAELSPLWAPVSFSSTPAGAALTVDGEKMGVTPATVELLSGRHTYEVSLPGHRPFRASVEVEARKSLEVPTVNLAAADGRLSIRSEPAGALVRVDGTVRGSTPLEVNVSPGAAHEIDLSISGYQDASRTVKVQAGGREEIQVPLQAITGEVVIAVQPAGAQLYINGKPQGDASQTVSLPAIPHDIEVKKDGYESYSTSITPRPDFAQSVRVSLKSAAQVQAEKTPARNQTSQGQAMVLIEGGRFRTGASRREPGRRANETILEVEITRPYYLATTEVTNTQFRMFREGHVSGSAGGFNLEVDTHPVVRVTWEDAALFCNWLSEREGLKPVYEIVGGEVVMTRPVGTGYRLPTEAEWVWAARYGGEEAARKYPWGDALPVVPGSGNYADSSAEAILPGKLADFEDGHAVTAPVGSFPVNALGLSDLGGNVAEWVQDIYGIYKADQPLMQDPVGPQQGELHVIRGAGWMDSSISELRLSYRDYGRKARPDLGFRIARYAE